jgi:uncharacterized protein YlxP (DUF503 family)
VAFVCLIRVELHLPSNGSLKGKRKEVRPLKLALQRRFGAAVAETDHHDRWQRAELSVALVGREAGEVSDAGAAVARLVHSRFPDGAVVEQRILSTDEVGDL